MNTQKQAWEKPKLMVLTRGTPEESVLFHCKYIGAGAGSTPNAVSQDGCNESPTNCGVCSARAGS